MSFLDRLRSRKMHGEEERFHPDDEEEEEGPEVEEEEKDGEKEDSGEEEAKGADEKEPAPGLRDRFFSFFPILIIALLLVGFLAYSAVMDKILQIPQQPYFSVDASMVPPDVEIHLSSAEAVRIWREIDGPTFTKKQMLTLEGSERLDVLTCVKIVLNHASSLVATTYGIRPVDAPDCPVQVQVHVKITGSPEVDRETLVAGLMQARYMWGSRNPVLVMPITRGFTFTEPDRQRVRMALEKMGPGFPSAFDLYSHKKGLQSTGLTVVLVLVALPFAKWGLKRLWPAAKSSASFIADWTWFLKGPKAAQEAKQGQLRSSYSRRGLLEDDGLE